MSAYNFLSTRVVRLRNVTIDGRHEDVNFEEASRKRASCARHRKSYNYFIYVWQIIIKRV